MKRLLLGLLVAFVPALAGAEILHRPDPDVEAGIAALEAGDAEGALAHFDRAARRHPREGAIHLNRGLALKELERFDEAREAFGQALAAGGASREALHGLGHLHAAQGELEQAIASFRSALEWDPEDAVARRNLEALLRLRQEQQNQQNPEESEEDSSEGDEDSSEDSSNEDSSEDSSEESSEESSERGSSDDEEEGSEEGAPEEQEGEDEGAEGRQGEEESSDSGQGQEESPAGDQESTDEGAAQGEGSPEPGEEDSPATGVAAEETPHSPSETERILDALKAREKSLQLFRTQDRKGRRTDAEKDW